MRSSNVHGLDASRAMPRGAPLAMAMALIATAAVGGCGQDTRAGHGVIAGDGGDSDDDGGGTGPLPDLAPPPDFAPPADLAPPLSPATRCPVPLLTDLYPGPFTPNPYGPAPAADDCVRRRHDAIILLGCPSDANGNPSACQTRRADIAVAMAAAGLGDWFIPTGNAVQNPHVEAEALRALLVARGVDPARVLLEPQARHTDENIYYSARIMEARGFTSAVVVSDDPGHLIMTAVCDANCCVELGRLSVFEFPVRIGGQSVAQKAGHYVRYPSTPAVSDAECAHVKQPLKVMCTNIGSRLACADDFRL